MLDKKDLEILSGSFDSKTLGVKVQSLSKDKTRAMLVLYLQHTDVTQRLEHVDPSWAFEIKHFNYKGDAALAHASMTLKGVTRENVGEGNDEKSAASDALKRCAMLFGVGRYLYDQPMLWIEYNEQRDKYKQWNYEDYEIALGRVQGTKNLAPSPQSPAPGSPRSPEPVRPMSPSQKPGDSGARCFVCNHALILSKKNNVYFCPNYKDKSAGSHTSFQADELQDHLKWQSEEDVP